MAHIRSLKYGRPTRGRPPEDREIPYEAGRGYHGGAPDYRLPDGYSGQVNNFVPSAYGYGITSRSGLTLQALYFDLDKPTAVQQVYNTALDPMILAVVSDDSGVNQIHKLEHRTATWSQLSRTGDALSHTSKNHVEIIQASSSALNRAIVVNGTNPPKAVDIYANVGIWSDFTFAYSIASTVYAGTMSDERLVLANLRTPSSDKPYGLMWSVRGTPSNFQVASGAGFADLNEMTSAIQKLVPDTQGFAILAEAEIWRARPRRDTFAFDFIPITREIGCPFPGTAVRSPFGSIFVGTDFEVYALTGSSLKGLGLAQDTNGISRIRRKIREGMEADPTFAWATYDFIEQRYHLQLSPTLAYVYDFRTDSWWPETYSFNAGYRGTMVTDIPAVRSSSRIWDDTVTSWDDTIIPWDESGIVRPPLEQSYILTISSVGAPYMRKSWVTQDYKTEFMSTWKTPRISANGRRYEYAGSWVEFSTQTASNLTVTTAYDDRAVVQRRSMQSSNLSTVWAPAHGVTRGASVKLEFNAGDRVNFTGITSLLRIQSGIGGGR